MVCGLAACNGGGSDQVGGPAGTCAQCTGGASGVDPTSPGGSTGTTASNQTTLTVGAGPSGTIDLNIPYATVTLCQPNTNTCATNDNVLVDTGSYGVRILASVLASSGLNLSNVADPNDGANTIAECVPFADGYTWGSIAPATLQIGGETAASVPINVLDDNGSYSPNVPNGCSGLTIYPSATSNSCMPMASWVWGSFPTTVESLVRSVPQRLAAVVLPTQSITVAIPPRAPATRLRSPSVHRSVTR